MLNHTFKLLLGLLMGLGLTSSVAHANKINTNWSFDTTDATYTVTSYEVINSIRYQSPDDDSDRILGTDYRHYLLVTINASDIQKNDSVQSHATFSPSDISIVNNVNENDALTDNDVPTNVQQAKLFKNVVWHDKDTSINYDKSKNFKLVFPIYTQDDVYLKKTYGSNKSTLKIHTTTSSNGITPDTPQPTNNHEMGAN